MKKLLLTTTLLMGLAGAAHAEGNDRALMFLTPGDLTTVTDNPESGDYLYRYDADSVNVTKVDATDLEDILGVTATATEITNVADDSARVNTITADTTLTCATHGTGQLNYVSAASGTVNVTLTLPAATGSGCQFWVGWSAAPNSGAGETGDVIQVTGNDSFNGVFMVAQDGGATANFFETASDTDKLTFSSTTGASVANVYVSFWDYATDKFQVGPNALIATGTEATPGATGQRS